MLLLKSRIDAIQHAWFQCDMASIVNVEVEDSAVSSWSGNDSDQTNVLKNCLVAYYTASPWGNLDPSSPQLRLT